MKIRHIKCSMGNICIEVCVTIISMSLDVIQYGVRIHHDRAYLYELTDSIWKYIYKQHVACRKTITYVT